MLHRPFIYQKLALFLSSADMTQHFRRLNSGFGRDDFRATWPVTVKPLWRAVNAGSVSRFTGFVWTERSIRVKWYAVPKISGFVWTYPLKFNYSRPWNVIKIIFGRTFLLFSRTTNNYYGFPWPHKAIYRWFNKGCFGQWYLGTGNLLFCVYSSKWLHCSVCPIAKHPSLI